MYSNKSNPEHLDHFPTYWFFPLGCHPIGTLFLALYVKRVQKKSLKLKEGIDINYKPISLKQFPCSFSLFPLSVLASPHEYCIWVQSNCSSLLITALNVRSNREYQQSGTISAETPLSYVELHESYRNSLCFISWAQYLSLLLVICNVWEITKVFAPFSSVNSTGFLGG